jgi:hypothetical protein
MLPLLRFSKHLKVGSQSSNSGLADFCLTRKVISLNSDDYVLRNCVSILKFELGFSFHFFSSIYLHTVKIRFSKRRIHFLLARRTWRLCSQCICTFCKSKVSYSGKQIGIPKDSNRRGLFTTEEAKEGEVLLQIPRNFVILKPSIQVFKFMMV